MHYRRMYDDSEMLYAYDLEGANGRDVVLQIEKVWGGELVGEKGRKSKKPFVKFVGKDKKLALNKTNGKAIATMYGPNTEEWVGKYIAIYATTTEYNGEQRECIRVRPRVPDVPSRSRNGKVAKPQPAPDFTEAELEQNMKDKGLIDETTKERVEKIEREAASDFARQKEWVEQIIGRSLDGNPNLTEAEQRMLKAAEQGDAS